MQDSGSDGRELPEDHEVGGDGVSGGAEPQGSGGAKPLGVGKDQEGGDARPAGTTDTGEPQVRLVEVVDRLTDLRRRLPDPDIDLCLVDLRAEAARQAVTDAEPEAPEGDWPPGYDDPFPENADGLPEIHASELTPEVLGGAVAHHGALVVREVFDPEEAEALAAAIERVHELRQSGVGPDTSPQEEAWYRPLPTPRPLRSAIERQMVARQGGTWLADSPATTAMVLHHLEDAGVIDAIAGHLGERPYFSLQKSTLRRSMPEPNIVGWHQDGSFLGPEVRTMNVWVSLSPCGGDLPTPGLEVVPRRLDELLPLGSDLTAHSIPFDVIDEVTADTPSIVPEFAPGDGLLFDQHFLHRTHLPDHMTSIRYAVECWFFAPSHHAPEYLPLLA